MRLKITVYFDDGDHVAMRFLEGVGVCDFTPAGEVFSIEEDIAGPDEIGQIEARVKEEARRRGISYVP